jgi:hypothetical protein
MVMNWKFAMLSAALLVLQNEPAPSAAPGESRVAIDVGPIPMEGVWYQDNKDHVHDTEVKLRQLYRKNGILMVDVSTGRPGGTDLELIFTHDESGATKVGLTANYRHDFQTEGSPVNQRLRDLEGRVMVHSNDWGPGKTLTCLFALQGRLGTEREFLLGSFLVVIPG